MKKSIGLLSALVVTSTFLINCQKAPDKRRVRPSNGKGAQTDVAEKAKLPTQVCSKEILELYKGFGGVYTNITRNRMTSETAEAQKKEMQSLIVETLAKCDQLIPRLQHGCMKDAGVKSDDNALTKEKMQSWCNQVGIILEKDHDHPNAYSQAANDAAKAKADNDKAHALVGTKGTVSKEGLEMAIEGNTNLGQFLVAGEIQTSVESLERALATSQTVCTFLGEGMKSDVEISNKLEILSFVEAEKNDLKDLDLDFSGQSTIVGLKLGKDITVEAPLACLNLDAKKLSVDALKKVFGSVITLGSTSATTSATQIITDVTTTEQKTATASVTIKIEKSESARQKSAELIAAKEKAKRLGDEAVAAQKELDVLGADASASDKADAQAKAKATRAAADSALATYEKLKAEASAAYDDAIQASLE